MRDAEGDLETAVIDRAIARTVAMDAVQEGVLLVDLEAAPGA
jgi:hypothetical protein